MPSVALEVGWSEGVAELDEAADSLIQDGVHSAILVKLNKDGARVQDTSFVEMRMRFKLVATGGSPPAQVPWTEFGSNLVQNPAPPPALVPQAGPDPAPVQNVQLTLPYASLYDSIAVPAGLPANIVLDMFLLQTHVRVAFVAFWNRTH